MWSLKAYMKVKCADPEFRDTYHEQCAVCPNTVLILTTIRDRGLSFEDAARLAGVETEHLRMLDEGDRCDLEDVRKLGKCLGLSISDECRRETWRKSKSR